MASNMKNESGQTEFDESGLPSRIGRMVDILDKFCKKFGLNYSVHISEIENKPDKFNYVGTSNKSSEGVQESLDRFYQLQMFLIERERFSDILNVPNFRVYFVNDKKMIDHRGLPEPELNKCYLVHRFWESPRNGALVFLLKDPESGKLIRPPKGYSGYSSKRFVLENYQVLN